MGRSPYCKKKDSREHDRKVGADFHVVVEKYDVGGIGEV